MGNDNVLVTGGSGFVAGHLIIQLLEQGHRVRATLRSLQTEEGVRTALHDAGMSVDAPLTFVSADLTRDDGWAAAVDGIDVVMHVASPVHLSGVTDEREVIDPARQGTLRVLEAARDAGVGRVVLTSALHAVAFGHGRVDRVFTEEDWTPLHGPGVDAYGRSKVLAEQAAWEFVRTEGNGLELTTMLPGAIMGPLIGAGISGANEIVHRILTGRLPGYPNLFIPIVDVRDVAAAHIAAMDTADAAGERFLVVSDTPPVAMQQIGSILTTHLGAAADRVPTRSIPDVIVRTAALFSAEFRSVAADLGHARKISGEKAARVLGVRPRDPEQAIIAAAESMLRAARRS